MMKRSMVYPILLIFVAIVLMWVFIFMSGLLSRNDVENPEIEARPINLEQQR